MAIIANGQVLQHGQPLAAIEGVRGKTWKKKIARDELESHQRVYQVISNRLFAGSTLIHVLADSCPEGFEPGEPGLLQRGVVIGVHIVQPHDLIAAVEQPVRHV